MRNAGKKLCFRNEAPVLNRCNESGKKSSEQKAANKKPIAQTSMVFANFQTSVIALLNIRSFASEKRERNFVQNGTRLKWLISRYSAYNYIEMCKLYASNVLLIMMEMYSMPFANTDRTTEKWRISLENRFNMSMQRWFLSLRAVLYIKRETALQNVLNPFFMGHWFVKISIR